MSLDTIKRPKIKVALTDVLIRKAKSSDKNYSLSDGNGLSILIDTNGNKGWRFRYTFNKTPGYMSLGVYPHVSLLDARELCREAKVLLAKGINPQRNKQEKKVKAQINALNTFECVAKDWHAKKLKDKSPKHQHKVKRWLEMYMFPSLGALPISSITGRMILETTSVLEKQNKLDTAHRILQTANQIFRYASQKEIVSYNPVPNLIGALPTPKVKHMAAPTEPAEVAELIKTIDGYNGTLPVQCALKLAPLVFQRIGELRHMKWDDLNFNKNEWRYWVSKSEVYHIVPLAKQALALIESMRPYSQGISEYVFPNGRTRDRPMSNNAINAALRNLGYNTKEDITGHGFRAIARTLLDEELNFEEKHIEVQLAHEIDPIFKGAYQRAKFLRDRKGMMQVWADYLDLLKTSPDPDNVNVQLI